jgi:hypothetical protein
MRVFWTTLLLALLIGCAPATQYVIPPMGAQAVSALTLEDRPTLDLTDAEITAFYKVSPIGVGKILKNQYGWRGYADVADSAVIGYQDYITKVFGGKVKAELSTKTPPKKMRFF